VAEARAALTLLAFHVVERVRPALKPALLADAGTGGRQPR